MSTTTIFTARRVHTMHRSNPTGDAVAVRDGRVVGVGTIDELTCWGEHTIDDRFRDSVIVPGFVEAHSHIGEGGAQAVAHVGYFDRMRSGGQVQPGCRSVDDVVNRLAAIAADTADNSPILALGLDPIYFPGERLTRHHLDRAADTRPIVVVHASGHLATVNSAALRQAGIDRTTPTEGVAKDETGEPNGELREGPAMSLIADYRNLQRIINDTSAIPRFAEMAHLGGVTTATDLIAMRLSDPARVAAWHEFVDAPDFPARVVPFIAPFAGNPTDFAESAELMLSLQRRRTEKLLWGGVKLMLDGSIQGWTAQVSFPGYLTGEHHGWWGMTPEALQEAMHAYHSAGLQVHAHCNGDLTSGLYIDAVEQALIRNPRGDHRHTVTHCQLTTPAQYRRMRNLGMCANIFSNHIRYWGDQHRDLTVGAHRARSMNAAATAKLLGVPFTLHSDAPVTPLGGLHLMWCAVNRLTASGQVLGEHERISAYDALEAVTLGGAYVLKLDHLVGSLEPGKYADFAVLSDDPLAVDPLAIKDIDVRATVVGGTVFE